MSLTLGSLFDGIGGWQLAAIRAGVKPIWSSEIERFPLAVTKTRFPDTKQLGDITKINTDEIEPVDIICAGSPCQDLSIANSGNRKGLSGERSGLFKIAINIIRRMRERTDGKYPKFFVWENVCGAFSTGYDADGNRMRGADFRAVLESLTEANIPMPANNRWADAGLVQCDGVNVGWRVLNASGWGVPQRRRRIFLVASFGRYSAAEVLFIEQSLQRSIEQSEKSKKRATGAVNKCAEMSSEIYDIAERRDALRIYKGSCPTLNAKMGTGGNNVPLIMQKTVGALCADDYKGPNNQYVNRDKLIFDVAKYALRRITPLEAERLQGLPDNWTLIDDKSCSDSARYRAIGNGMCQNCADFIVRQIVGVTENELYRSN